MGPLSSSSKPNCRALSYSHGCSPSAASVTPSIMTIQCKFCWTLEVVTWSPAGEVAGQGRSCCGGGLSVERGLGRGKEYNQPKEQIDTE